MATKSWRIVYKGMTSWFSFARFIGYVDFYIHVYVTIRLYAILKSHKYFIHGYYFLSRKQLDTFDGIIASTGNVFITRLYFRLHLSDRVMRSPMGWRNNSLVCLNIAQTPNHPANIGHKLVSVNWGQGNRSLFWPILCCLMFQPPVI